MTDKELDMLDDSGLDIVNFLQILWKHKVVIIALVVASSLLMFIKTMVFTENTYTSYGVLHISNKKEETNGTAAIQKNDIETSKTLSTTYRDFKDESLFERSQRRGRREIFKRTNRRYAEYFYGKQYGIA